MARRWWAPRPVATGCLPVMVCVWLLLTRLLAGRQVRLIPAVLAGGRAGHVLDDLQLDGVAIDHVPHRTGQLRRVEGGRGLQLHPHPEVPSRLLMDLPAVHGRVP